MCITIIIINSTKITITPVKVQTQLQYLLKMNTGWQSIAHTRLQQQHCTGNSSRLTRKIWSVSLCRPACRWTAAHSRPAAKPTGHSSFRRRTLSASGKQPERRKRPGVGCWQHCGSARHSDQGVTWQQRKPETVRPGNGATNGARAPASDIASKPDGHTDPCRFTDMKLTSYLLITLIARLVVQHSITMLVTSKVWMQWARDATDYT